MGLVDHATVISLSRHCLLLSISVRVAMDSRVLNVRGLKAGARLFRMRGACLLNNDSAPSITSKEYRSRCQPHQQLHAVSFSMLAMPSHASSCSGECLPRPQGNLVGLKSGCVLRGSYKLDHGRVSTAVLGDSKTISVRCFVAAATAAGTQPLVSLAWHPRALSTSPPSSGKDSSDQVEKSSSSREDDAEESEVKAAVAETVEATEEEPRHTDVEMPNITTDERVGKITSWSFGVGDAIKAGETVCEIELKQFSVGVNVDFSGFLARILVPAGSEDVAVGTPIAVVVYSEEDVSFYQNQEEDRESTGIEEESAEASQTVENFSWKDVLKAVSRLQKDGKLTEETASTLMSLSRKKNVDLLEAFEGCFEGDVFSGEIDDDLFVTQARDIVNIAREAKEEKEATSSKEDNK